MLSQAVKEASVQSQHVNLLSGSSPLNSCASLIGMVMMQYQKHYSALLVMDVNSHK